MKIDEATFKRMPAGLQSMFQKLPNSGSNEVLALFPTNAGGGHWHNKRSENSILGKTSGGNPEVKADGVGSAARFFYAAKVSAKERNEGLEFLPDKDWSGDGAAIPERDNRPFNPSKNNHPTVKPTTLMRYLCRLVTPPGGTVLDPWMGSGSTGKAARLEGFEFIGMEQDEGYFQIAQARCGVDPLEGVW